MVFLAFSLSAGYEKGNSKAWEIKAYSSAAPAYIGDNATIIGASGKVSSRLLDVSMNLIMYFFANGCVERGKLLF